MQVKSWQINFSQLSIQWLPVSNYEFIIDDTEKKRRNGWLSSAGRSARDTQENNAARTVGGQSTVHCVGGRGGYCLLCTSSVMSPYVLRDFQRINVEVLSIHILLTLYTCYTCIKL